MSAPITKTNTGPRSLCPNCGRFADKAVTRDDEMHNCVRHTSYICGQMHIWQVKWIAKEEPA